MAERITLEDLRPAEGATHKTEADHQVTVKHLAAVITVKDNVQAALKREVLKADKCHHTDKCLNLKVLQTLQLLTAQKST